MKINFSPIFNYKNNFQNKNTSTPIFKTLNIDTFTFQGKPKPLYGIKFNGEVIKFSNLDEAQKATGCTKNTISDVMGNRRKSSDGYIFVQANEIEEENKNGELIPNKKKINKLREKFLLVEKNYPIILISQDHTTEIFETVKTACNKTRLPSSSFFRALSQPKYGAGSRAVAKLNDVVLKDKNGNVIFNNDGTFALDDEKLTKYYSAYFCKGKQIDTISFTSAPKRIYAIDYEGNIQYFNNRQEASNKLGIAKSRITDSIYDKQVACGYIFINANQLEIDNYEGEKILDLDKIQELTNMFSSANSMPVCTIDLLGNVKRFLNPKDMQSKTKIPQDRISDILNRSNHCFETKGLLIVRENDILARDEYGKIKKDSAGNYLYNLETIAKLMKAFTEGKIKPVIARDIKTEETLIFKSATEAARYLCVSKQAVDACLKNISHTCSGYTIDYYDKSAINDFLGL